MKFYDYCDRFPPPLVRLMARRGRRAMTTAEIAAAASWGSMFVESVFKERDWDDVDLSVLKRITRACGMDFSSSADMNRAECYLRSKPNFDYLTKDENWKTYYLPLIVSWRKSITLPIPTELPDPIRRLLQSIPIK